MSKIVNENLTVTERIHLGSDIYLFRLAPFTRAGLIKPGQFVHIRIPESNIYFRRAFSVYDMEPENKTIEIMFKVFGRGTSLLSKLHKGDTLDVLGPLGNGFKLPSRSERITLIAGGIGMPPVYLLARKLIDKNYDKSKLIFFYGGVTGADLVHMARIRRLGIKLVASTDDGSFGYRGFVTDAVRNETDFRGNKCRIYACGPEGMLKAVERLATEFRIPGQLSLEAPMPCGIGICLGCVRPLAAGGHTRVCRDGPVYDIGEVVL